MNVQSRIEIPHSILKLTLPRSQELGDFLHPYDFISGRYLCDNSCSLCRFVNLHLSRFSTSIAFDCKVLDFNSFTFDFRHENRISVPVIENTFCKVFLNKYASIPNIRSFRPTGSDLTPHWHGTVSQERSCHCDRVGSGICGFHRSGDWCFSWASRCTNSNPHRSERLLDAWSEGSSTSCWSASCSKCKAVMWCNGFGGSLALFYILHLYKILQDPVTRACFMLDVNTGECSQISNFAAKELHTSCVFLQIEGEELVIGENLPKDVLPKVEKGTKPKRGNSVEMVVSDAVGNHSCRGKGFHAWVIQWPSVNLHLELTPSVNLFFDHMLKPRFLERQRSCRAYGMFGLIHWAPRINWEMAQSIILRNKLSQELKVQFGFEEEEDEFCESSCMPFKGEAQMSKEVYSDPETGGHYAIDSEGEAYWLDSEHESVEVEHLEEDVQDEVRSVTSSLAETVGSLIASHADFNESLHRLCEYPCVAINDSFRDFGKWLEGKEIGEGVKAIDFPKWVKGPFKDIIRHIVKQIEDSAKYVENQVAKQDKDIQTLKTQAENVKNMLIKFNEKLDDLSGEVSKVGESKLSPKLERRIKRLEERIKSLSDETLNDEGELIDRLLSEIDSRISEKLSKSNKKIVDLGKKLKDLSAKIERGISEKKEEKKNESESEEEIPVKRPTRPAVIPGTERDAQFPRFRGTRQMSGSPEEESRLETGGDHEVSFANIANIVSAKVDVVGDTSGGSSDVLKLVGADYVVKRFKWEVNNPPGTVFENIHYPEELFEASTWLKTVSTMFQYFRCDGIHVKVAITSNVMQGGSLMIVWDSMSNSLRRGIVDIFALSNCYWRLIEAGTNNMVEFMIPFEAIESRLSLAGFELGLLSLGSLRFASLCPLVVAEGTTPYVDVTVSTKFINPVFAVRTKIHEFRAKLDVNEFKSNRKLKGSAQGDIVGEGIERAQMSAAVRENVLYTGRWSSSSPANLVSLSVGPGQVVKGSTGLTPTSLAMLASLYHYWRGTIVYNVYIGANGFTTGRLHICALPGQYITDYPKPTEIMGLGGILYSLDSGKKMCSLEVPFYGIGEKQRVQRYSILDGMYFGEDVVTRLHITVIDKLITNVGATDAIYFAITVKPGYDFKLYNPVGLILSTPKMFKIDRNGGAAQGGDEIVPVDKAGQSLDLRIMMRDGIDNIDFLTNWGHLIELEFQNVGTSYSIKVAPLLQNLGTANNVLAWYSSLFTRWKGDLEYQLLVGPHNRNKNKYMLIWHMNEDPDMTAEICANTTSIAPTGGKFVKWDINVTDSFIFKASYQSRFLSLAMPHASLEDLSFHPTYYYNGSMWMSYVGDEKIDVRIFIRPCENYKLMHTCGLNIAGQDSGDFKLPYFNKLVSAEDTPVIRKNKNLEEIELMKGKPIMKFVGSAQNDVGGLGSLISSLIFGKGNANAMKSINLENIAGLTQFLDFGNNDTNAKLSDVIKNLVPLLINLNETVVSSNEILKESKKSATFLTQLSDIGTKILNFMSSLLKESSLGFLVAKAQGGALVIPIIGMILLIVAGWWWYQGSGERSWLSNVTIAIGIIWAPLLGSRAMEFATWLRGKLEEVWDRKDIRKEESSGKEFRLPIRGAAQNGCVDFLIEISDYFGCILGAIFAVGSLFILNVMPSDKIIKSWTDSFDDIGKKARSLTSIGQFLNLISKWNDTFVKKFYEWIYKLKGTSALGNTKLETLVKFDVLQWANDVNELSLEEQKWLEVDNEEKVSYIRSLFDKSLILQKVMLTNSLSPTAVSVLRDCFQKITKLLNETHCARGMSKPRIDPIHFAFVGKPGCGKSAIISSFLADVLDAEEVPITDRVYARSAADQYWSRYIGQPAVLYDDLGALCGDPSFTDYGEFISLKANVPYPLNMAAVEEKGTMFCSKYLFSTSNNLLLDGNINLRTPEAFYRRRDLCIIAEKVGDFEEGVPGSGMVFTVVNSNNGSLRTEWPCYIPEEYKLCVLNRVSYPKLLAFAIMFTKAYMKNQKSIVSTLEKNLGVAQREDKESVDKMLESLVREREDEDFQVLPQAEELKKKKEKPQMRGRRQGAEEDCGKFMDSYHDAASLISWFDGIKISGHEIYKDLNIEGSYPEELRNHTETSFAKIVNLLHPHDHCVAGGICDNFWRHAAFNRYGKSCFQYLWKDGKIVYKMHRSPKDSADLFLSLYMIRHTVAEDVANVLLCPANVFKKNKFLPQEGIKEVKEVKEQEDREEVITGIDIYDDYPLTDGWVILNNTKMETMYPEYVERFGGFPLIIGEHKYYVGNSFGRFKENFNESEYPEMYQQIVKGFDVEVAGILCSGVEKIDVVLIRSIIANLANKTDIELQDEDEPLNIQMNEVYDGKKGLIFLTGILVIATIRESIEEEEKKRRMIQEREKKRLLLSKLQEEQWALINGEQSWVTRMLTYGGLLVGVGAIAGMFVGLSKAFSWMFSSGSKDNKKEEEEESDEIEIVTAEGFSTSGDFRTRWQTKRKNYTDSPSSSRRQVERVVAEGPGGSRSHGTKGRSNDQETRWARTKRYVVRKGIVFGAAQNKVSTFGIALDEDNRPDGMHPIALSIAGVKMMNEVGIVAQSSAKVAEEAKKESVVLDCASAWQEEMLGKRNVTDLEKEENFVVDQNEEKCVISKENCTFVIPKNAKPRDDGIYFEGDTNFYKTRPTEEHLLPPERESLKLRKLEEKVEDVEEVIAQGARGTSREFLTRLENYKRNCVQILTVSSQKRLLGVMICSTFFMCPAHYVSCMRNGEELILVSYSGIQNLRFDASKVYVLSNYQDVVIMDLGVRCPLFRDIRSSFITQKEMLMYKTERGCMMSVVYEPKGRTCLMQFLPKVELIGNNSRLPTVTYEVGDGEYHIVVSGLKYPAFTQHGSCGSIVVTANPELQYKICGIHVAAHLENSVGYSELICKESLDFVVENPEVKAHFLADPREMEFAELHDEEGEMQTTRRPELSIVGVMQSDKCPKNPTSTTIMKSKIHGMIGEVVTEPSILNSYDYRLSDKYQEDGVDKRGKCDPLLEAVEKYGERTASFEEKQILLVERALTKHFKRKDNNAKRRQLLTLDEAVNGIDQEGGFEGLNMDTAPGWPYVLKRPQNTHGKEFLFEEVEPFPSGRKRWVIKDEELIGDVIKREENAKKRIHTPMITTECSKDERRKKKKIYEKVATRSFTILPVDINLLYRKYFLDFGVMLMHNFPNSFCKVGINPDSMDWSEMMNKWLGKSEYGFCGDYAKFDGISDPAILMSICRVVNSWYGDGEENAKIRETLLMDAFHRKSLIRNVLVEINQGMPSGFPMTALFNSLVNFYYISMAWVEILEHTPLTEYATVPEFLDVCDFAAYGDDNVVVVPPVFLDYFNLRSVAKFLSKFGITYTDDQKRPIEESEPYCKIVDVTFLKRSFKKMDKSGMLWRAPLDKVSIEEQCHWIRDPKSSELEVDAMYQNVNNALYEASLHGKVYFKDLKSRVNSALSTIMLDPVDITHGDCVRRFWQNMFAGQVKSADVNMLVMRGALNSEEDLWSKNVVSLGEEILSLGSLLQRCSNPYSESLSLDVL